MENGDRLLALGQHKAAVVEYEAALRIDPSAHAQRGLGLAYEALSAHAQAQVHLEAAVEAKPNDVEARVALARVCARFGQMDRARSELLAAVEVDPDNAAALAFFAIYAESRADVTRAIGLLQSHATRHTGRPSGHELAVVLADLELRDGRSGAAATHEKASYVPLGNPRLTLELARAGHARENYELVRALLGPLLERKEDELDAWQLLASAALGLGDTSEARHALEHLSSRASEPEVRLLGARVGLADGLQVAPTKELRALLAELPRDQAHERARLRRFLAEALSKQRKFTEAEVELRALLAEQPDNVEGSLALAELQLAQHESSKAIQTLSAVADPRGRLARAYQLLGQAQLESGDVVAAEATFRRLYELAPQKPEACHWLARALERGGQVASAQRLLQANLKRFASHVDTLQTLAGLLEKTSGTKAAEAFVLGHGREHAESPAIARAEAGWLLAHDEVELALVAYRRALANDPGFYPAVAGLGTFYARHGKLNLAYGVLDAALSQAPQNVDTYLLATRLSLDVRRYEIAKEYAERGLAQSPSHPLLLAALGSVIAEGFRDVTRARELIEKACASAPEHPDVLDAEGWLSQLEGAAPRAVGILEKAAQADPENPRILYHLGAALLAAGQAQRSSERFTRVLELDPMFPTAKELRSLLAVRH